MKKFIFFNLFLFSTILMKGQDYKISFRGIENSVIIDSVIVENLNQGSKINLVGEDLLYLGSLKTGLNQFSDFKHPLRIYPNPSSYGDCNIEFYAPANGNVSLELFDINSRKVANFQSYLKIGNQLFKVTGLSNGIYTLRIHSSNYSFVGKIIGISITNSEVNINYIGNGISNFNKLEIKNASITKMMQYNNGDLLKITGFSGNNRTIFMLVPNKNQTINFPFFSCTDENGNNYPIVKIGNQFWMAENLKTNKYQNGEPINFVEDDTQWLSLLTGANCYYDNDKSNFLNYGYLYNGFAVNDKRKIAPRGWHVPGKEEWEILTNYLGGTSIAGSKLKETGFGHWKRPNSDATNESGFTAVSGGLRKENARFEHIGYYGYWWFNSTSSNSKLGDYCFLSNETSLIDTSQNNMNNGMSVRCVLGDLPELETIEFSSVNSFSANCVSNIKSDGNLPILNKGVCYSTSPNPTISDFKTLNGKGNDSFSSVLTRLKENTTYYVRAYATNELGTSYGNELKFKTPQIGLNVSGYSKDIVLFKHFDGRIFCTLSGDFSTFDRNGANKITLYNFANNGYSGYNINNAILLPSGTVIVALTSYNQTLKFLRSTNSSYTAWELVNDDWNGSMLYRGWTFSPDGTLIAGEYPTHNNILKVRLWKITDDGKTWKIIHTFNGRQGTLFEQKQIFHIHTIGYDKYTGLFWIGTGDKDHESSVWTYDGTSLSLIGQGSQLWRICSFVFTPDFVFWGTDGKINYENSSTCCMIRFHKVTGTAEIVSSTESVMFNCEEININGTQYYLSCGTPNHIYLSNDGKNWKNVLNLTLDPKLPNSYSWFYNFVDNGDGRMFGYVTGILREDNGQPLTNGGTVILDMK